jgi:CO/xanthine dehydrogenase FAD-binding subunit
VKAVSPTTLAEAVAILAAEPHLRPVAGCTDLMVTTPEGRADLPGVLNVLGIPELRGIERRGEAVEIGAAATFSEIRRSPLLREHCPALVAAAGEVGGWQIQNRATLGGNLANASPAGDSLPVLLALGATVVVVGAGGERAVPHAAFHTGYRQTALKPGELIARVVVPVPSPGSRQSFRKVGTRLAQAISKVVVAGWAEIPDGTFTALRLAAGSVAATPIRLRSVEAAVLGRPADEATADLAGQRAAAAVEPIDDVRSTAEYRRFALQRVVRRMVLEFGNLEETEKP